MKKLGTLIGGDLRQIARDRTLLSFLGFPLLVWGFFRWGVPYLTEKYPLLADYHDVLLMFGGMQSAVLFGFIVGFLMVDEKDEHVMEVIRVLPISSRFFLLYRLLFASVIAGVLAFFIMMCSGFAYPGLVIALGVSILYGLTAPLITLAIATFAANKIEGMAIFKTIDLVLMLPLLAFFIEGPLRYLFGVIPVFWAYAFLERGLAGELVWWYLGMGFVAYAIIIISLAQQFKHRVFFR